MTARIRAGVVAMLALGACSGERPDEMGASAGGEDEELASPRAQLASAAGWQGVVVTWDGGPWRFDYDWGGGEALDPAEATVEQVAVPVARELDIYPPGFLQAHGVHEIVLVTDLLVREEGAERPASGYIFEGRFLVDAAAAARGAERGERVRFFHHVLWHQLDELQGRLWEDPEWAAANPEDFEYGVYSPGGIHETRAGTGRLSTEHPGFLNVYSMGYLPDDKAEVFAYLMVIAGWMEDRAGADPYLRAKIEIIRRRLAELDSRFDAAFWERLREGGDDAEPYGSP